MLFISPLKAFCQKSLRRRPNCSADTDMRSDLGHFDKKIAKLEQEFHEAERDLMVLFLILSKTK